MAAFDLIAFGHAQPSVHTHLHASIYRIVQNACQASALDWTRCHHEDRGDGLLLIFPPDVSAHLLLDTFPAHLHAGVRRHNTLSSAAAQLRLRTAIHAGYLHNGDYGIDGLDLLHLFRMLNAPAFKSVVDLQHADHALIISDYLHTQIRQDPCGLTDPTAYQPLLIDTKETHALCWAWTPPPSATSEKALARLPIIRDNDFAFTVTAKGSEVTVPLPADSVPALGLDPAIAYQIRGLVYDSLSGQMIDFRRRNRSPYRSDGRRCFRPVNLRCRNEEN
jgi:hypothetical protein